jgi:hypothetical protein
MEVVDHLIHPSNVSIGEYTGMRRWFIKHDGNCLLVWLARVDF